MNSPSEIVDRVGGRFPVPDDAFDRLARRRDRKRRNQRIGARALALVIVLAAAGAFARAVLFEGIPADRTRPPTRVHWDTVPGVSIDGDALVDIRTGEVTPLPDSITSFRDRWGDAVAPGGDVMLFEASVEGSKRTQIFVANLDGTSVRQLTDAPGGAWDGAWSPDGAKIAAILGDGSGGQEVDLVLIDVVTGETTRLARGKNLSISRFISDGRLRQWIFVLRHANGQISKSDVHMIHPGGVDPVVIELEEYPWVGLFVPDLPWDVTYSPDGRMITYTKFVSVGSTGGLELWLANERGSDRRPLVPDDEPFSDNPSWSPDGTRIVFTKRRTSAEELVAVVDVASGTPTFTVHTPQPATGSWLDDHTLLVNVGAFS